MSLVGFLLPPFCAKLNLLWLTARLAYHCSIAMMQASNDMFLGGGDTSPAALHHVSQTLAEVKKRLESRDALSDTTMGIVVSLINQEQIRKHHSAAEVHVMGLKRIVDLRGGLDQLQENIPLVLKICK